MIRYVVRRSQRAKYMRLAVHPGGEVILTVPHQFSMATIEQFLARHTQWIERSVRKMHHLKPLPGGKREYATHRESVRALVRERLAYWNSFYRFRIGRVAIKNTRSLWGSCSRKGNLNFSYKILFLPRELVDYIIVHELCHIAEHNHSPRFWALVSKAQPEYLRLRRELRRYILR